jgi:hypothetical protein
MRASNPIEHPPQGSPFFGDEDIVKFLHIPRTGGHARAASLKGAALHGLVAIAPHNTKASMCKGPVICFLRDPVTRFLSAARRLKMDPNMLLESRGKGVDKLSPGPALLLRDQAWWLDRPNVQTYQMEQLDRVWYGIMEEYDIPHNPLPVHGAADRNESVGGLPKVPPDVGRAIENSYDEDMDLWVSSYAY